MFLLNDINVRGRVENLSEHFEPGQQWHVIGPNGAGKSSLLGILAGVLAPESGQVNFNGRQLSDYHILELAHQRCLLQQQQATAFDIPLRQLLTFYTQHEKLNERLEDCLHLHDLMDKPLSMLSGGQQQRFNIARNLMQIWPQCEQGQAALLLDEPCQQLDINHQFHLMRLLNELVELGNIVVMSSHDINLSLEHASHVILLKNNRVIASGECKSVLTLENLNTVFDHQFVELALFEPQTLANSQWQNGLPSSKKYIASAPNQAPLR